MLLASLSGVCCQQKMTCSSLYRPFFRSGFDRNVDKKSKNLTDFTTPAAMTKQKKRGLSLSPMAAAAPVKTGGFSPPKFYQQVMTAARANFTQEISFQSKDKDISLTKTLLHISAEDEAFIAYNREMDANSFQNEREGSTVSSDCKDLSHTESMLMAGKRIEEWLLELDAIAKEVEVELISRDIGCHLIEVLEAVNKVLFESRGFKRSTVVDSKCSYLHSVLSSKCGSAILLSIIYIEVCRRLNLTIVGSRVGEDFLIWPQTGNPEELFKVNSGHSLFGIVNGRCVEDPKSKASDLNSNSLPGLDIATNRDIIGIYLANLIRLHWKRASRMIRGLMLTSPLRPVHDDKTDGSSLPLLRPQDLRLAIMASEKLLILQPHDWALRRDHGMMLYFSREYGEAVQELSICMAFAPEEEAEILEPFVEKLHLLRLESSWKSLGHKGLALCNRAMPISLASPAPLTPLHTKPPILLRSLRPTLFHTTTFATIIPTRISTLGHLWKSLPSTSYFPCSRKTQTKLLPNIPSFPLLSGSFGGGASGGSGSSNWWDRWHNDGNDGNNNENDNSGIKRCFFCIILALLFQLASRAYAIDSGSEIGSNDEEIVWEVKGGKRTKLIADHLADVFIVPLVTWAWWPPSSSSTTSSTMSFGNIIPNMWVQCRELFMRLMLPEGFPDSVTSDYMEYSLWRGVQGIAAQVSSVLATQSLLYAVGLGKGAIPTAAAVNWVLKDGIGYLSKIFLSKFGRHFDVNPKGWRLFADFMENAAFGMEILTPAFPHLFVPIGAAAGAGRSAASLIQAATRSCFFAGFAAQRNFAEVIAKGEAQGMVSKSIGIMVGIALANCIQASTPLALASFGVFTWIHMFCNLKSYQSIQLRTLNPYRASLVFGEYLLSGVVPSVKEVNDEEPFFPALPLLSLKPPSKAEHTVLSTEAKEAAATIEQRLELGSKLSDIIKTRADAHALLDLYKNESYILTEHSGKFCVILKDTCSPQDMLKSMFHVSYLYWLEKNVGLKSVSIFEDCGVGGMLQISLEYVEREFSHAKNDGEVAGWVTDSLVARPLPHRIRPDC